MGKFFITPSSIRAMRKPVPLAEEVAVSYREGKKITGELEHWAKRKARGIKPKIEKPSKGVRVKKPKKSKRVAPEIEGRLNTYVKTLRQRVDKKFDTEKLYSQRVDAEIRQGTSRMTLKDPTIVQRSRKADKSRFKYFSKRRDIYNRRVNKLITPVERESISKKWPLYWK